MKFDSNGIRVSPWDLFLGPVVAGPPDGGKAVHAGYDHIVGAEGTVNNE